MGWPASKEAAKSLKIFMIIGPRYKICKRLGNGVFDKCQTQKFSVAESRKKAGGKDSRPRMLSDYGKQLLEKQRVRFTYGITESQLAKYVEESSIAKGGNHADTLLRMLECRLDNIVYRMGLAPTRRAARQAVVHGHVAVNGKKVTIPSYSVSEKDTVSIRERSRTSPLYEGAKERIQEWTRPMWLTFDIKKFEGTLKNTPSKENTDTVFNLSAVLEYYSR